jgi:hypothetical protein
MPNGNGLNSGIEWVLRSVVAAMILAVFGKAFIYDPPALEDKASKAMVIAIKNDLSDEITRNRLENFNRLCDRMGFLEKNMQSLVQAVKELDIKVDKLSR